MILHGTRKMGAGRLVARGFRILQMLPRRMAKVNFLSYPQEERVIICRIKPNQKRFLGAGMHQYFDYHLKRCFEPADLASRMVCHI